jgi:hypothetical protein
VCRRRPRGATGAHEEAKGELSRFESPIEPVVLASCGRMTCVHSISNALIALPNDLECRLLLTALILAPRGIRAPEIIGGSAGGGVASEDEEPV